MPERSHARNALWLIVATFVGCAILAGALLWHDNSGGTSAPGNRPIVAQEANYVTSNSCRSCHPGNYASWHASFHRTMTQVATPATLIPEAADVELTWAGRQYKLAHRDGKIFVSDRSLGEKDYGPPREVVLLTGSHTLQILWNETGQGAPRAVSFCLYHRGEDVGARHANLPHAAGNQGGVFDRVMEWRLHGLPRHPGSVEVC